LPFYLKITNINFKKQEIMNKAVFKEDPAKTYFSGEGCFINELFNEVNHSGGSIAKATVKPEMITENHLLSDTDEWYYILEGIGEMYLNGQSIGEVKRGETVHIPQNTPQYIKNTGTEDLVFLCFCTPAFKMEVYNKVE
jgi:mannose-6-phosphate isomerase-like protein (cupin superfamily)